MPHPTLNELNAMNELRFDAAVGLLENAAERGDAEAAELLRCIDTVIEQCGTYDL